MTDAAAIGPEHRRQAGRRRLPWLLAVAVLGLAGYLGGPFLTLWRITRAMDRADLATLESVIDWPQLRQGLKDDVAEGVLGMPQETLVASNTLPPFGAGFVSGIACSQIDRAVTPAGLVQAARAAAGGDAALLFPASLPFPTIVGFGLLSPLLFDLRLRLPGQEIGEDPLHLRLAFQGGVWRVVRVWIPQDLMDRTTEGS